MSQFRLEAKDEYTHRPTAEHNFNESVYTNAFDAGGRHGGWMRLGNRVNEGHAELSVCLYLPDGRVACQFQRPPIASNDHHAAGGLVYTVHEPFKDVQMQYRGEVMLLDNPDAMRDPRAAFANAPRVACEVDWRHHGVSPLHGGEPLTAAQPTMYGRDFSLGHFNQHTAVRGHMRIGSETFIVDGHGWRDHSWGPRYWTNIHFYRLFIGNFGPDRGMMILKITDREGLTRRVGVLQVDGDYEEITDLDVLTEWTPQKDPRVVRLGVRTARRAVRIDGEIRTLVPLRNRRKEGDFSFESRIAEGFTQWTWDDRQGCGMTEYIEVLDDGQPVGWPL
ncbi:MAG: hypothetical protein IT493_15085 [Gammaproteobacteria bacterium]|nr:hypothetical protein [Gammaproteobacteria bacterium]